MDAHIGQWTYRTLGLRAAEVSVCIDLFCLSQNYVDVSTCGVLSHMTGGSVYHYEKFTVQHCAQQFLNDLRSSSIIDHVTLWMFGDQGGM